MKRMIKVLAAWSCAAILPLAVQAAGTKDAAVTEDAYVTEEAAEDSAYNDGPAPEPDDEPFINRKNKGFLGFGTAGLPAPLLRVLSYSFDYFSKTRGLQPKLAAGGGLPYGAGGGRPI